jgi:tetratricopeptide (TPR) repeat protein
VGKLDKAIEHFTIALKINPYYLEAYINLQAVLKKIDNPKKISEHP